MLIYADFKDDVYTWLQVINRIVVNETGIFL